MKELLQYLQSQHLMVIACHDGNELWTANIYIGADEKGQIYFVGPLDTKHSQMILKNPNVSFASAWFDPKNHGNRKGIQGLGTCAPADSDEEIAQGIALHNQNFPEFKDRITVKWIHEDANRKVWVLKPTFIKYWDDELYGEEESQEFNFGKPAGRGG